MKVLQLNLLAFGPFTDVKVDLNEGEEGLHILYGPNEAGKSSALRALRQMLYGIPERSLDGFLHPYAKMRIGGVLRHSDGTEIEVIRRKGRVNTLRDGDDKKPVDEAIFQKFLGNIDADVFSTMFGIGHADLVRGGEEIIRGGGDVGRALFAAGAGISDLRKVQMELQAEAEALFTPSASTRPINKAISNLREKQKALRDAQLPGQEWEKHDTALRKATERREKVDLELQAKEAEEHRLKRIRDALPLISRRRELAEELESYSDAVLLPEDFTERRTRFLTDLQIAQNNRDRAWEDAQGTARAMEQLDINEAVIDRADQIEGFYRELGSYQKAATDRVKLQRQRDVLWTEAGEILSGLRDDLSLDEAEKLRLKKAETVRIQELGKQYERLMERLESAKQGISKVGLQIKGLEEDLMAFQTPVSVDELKEALERAMKLSALEDHYHSEQREIESVLKSLEDSLGKQALWHGTVEELQNLPLPSMETIDAFDREIDEAQMKLSQLQSERSGLEEEILDIGGQLKALELEREVPTEEDLNEARRHREEGWRLVRNALEGANESGGEPRSFIDSFEPAESLAEAYEFSVQEADQVADRLRREADRVARKAKLVSDQETRKTRLERLEAKVEEARREFDEITGRWMQLWEPLGISPKTPREMRAWVQDQEGIIKQFSEVQEKRRKVQELRVSMEGCRRKLDDCLRSISESPAKEDESLTDLTGRCRRIIERQEGIRTRRERLLSEKKQKEEDLKEADSRLKEVEEDLALWQSRWEEAVRPLGLGADALPAQAGAVMEDLATLFDKLKEANNLHQRIQGIDRDARAFTDKVVALVQQVAPDLKDLPFEQAVQELHTRLNRSRAANSQLDRLKKQRDQQEERVREAEQHILEIRAGLDTMCEEAGCSKYEDLAEAERRSLRRREMETGIKGLEEQLYKLSAGAPIEDFITEALAVDPDGIDSRIARLGEEIDELNQEKSGLDRTIGEEGNELRKMDGSPRAAELAEETQGILAGLEKNVEQYARLRLASTVLARGIEKYREKHQGPVLKRTNELFARLTLGYFEGIRAEFDEQGNPVLMGVRPGGKELVGVEGMSDGTTDQLYLALRLASLESYLDGNEPMPFIVDDILIKFDNERAGAALQILSELSRKTQVIFFTHHRHLVELAEENIEPGLLFRHSLNSEVPFS